MRICRTLFLLALLTGIAWTQQATIPAAPGQNKTAGNDPLTQIFDAKIRAEWEALKNKDKKAYGELLADDYQGVEIDRRGERNKIQAINEVSEGNVYAYTLFGLKVLPLGADAAFVIYESTLQFPPKAQVRYSRVYIGEVWVKRAGQWKILHYQETSVK